MANYYCKAPHDCGCAIWNYGKIDPRFCTDCLNYVTTQKYTNADYIRYMDNEELASFLDSIKCGYCMRRGNNCFPISMEEWLLQEYKGE